MACWLFVDTVHVDLTLCDIAFNLALLHRICPSLTSFEHPRIPLRPLVNCIRTFPLSFLHQGHAYRQSSSAVDFVVCVAFTWRIFSRTLYRWAPSSYHTLSLLYPSKVQTTDSDQSQSRLLVNPRNLKLRSQQHNPTPLRPALFAFTFLSMPPV